MQEVIQPQFSQEDILKIKEKTLSKETNLASKFRAVFTLRNLKGRDAIDALVEVYLFHTNFFFFDPQFSFFSFKKII